MEPSAGCRAQECSYARVAAVIGGQGRGVAPLVDAAGVLSAAVYPRDVLRALAAGIPFAATGPGDIPRRPLAFAYAHTPICEVLERMARWRVRSLPILDDRRRVLGCVTLEAIVACAASDRELGAALQRLVEKRVFWTGDPWR